MACAEIATSASRPPVASPRFRERPAQWERGRQIERTHPRPIASGERRHALLGTGVSVRGDRSPFGEMRVVSEVDRKLAATFALEDRLSPDAREVFGRILGRGVEFAVATSDRGAGAEHAVRELGLSLVIESECTPATKLALIRAKQAVGRVVGMVGDSIKDAPGLAHADVGLVVALEGRTAWSEAADVVLLGGEVQQVRPALAIAQQTHSRCHPGAVAWHRPVRTRHAGRQQLDTCHHCWEHPAGGYRRGGDRQRLAGQARRSVLIAASAAASLNVTNKPARRVDLLSAQGP
jgi:soluble P-type ATPase